MAESQEIEGLVRALRDGDDAAKMSAAQALMCRVVHNYANGDLLVQAGGIPVLVELLRDGSAAVKTWAARALSVLSVGSSTWVLIAEAGAIAPLVQLLRDGSTEAKERAAYTLRCLVNNNVNAVLITEAGGIAPLVELLRDATLRASAIWAGMTLRDLADINDAYAVAIALTVGFDAVVELARRGSVTVNNWSGPRDINGRGLLRPEEELIVSNAGVPAKRKAALVVAKLVGACVPDTVPRDIKSVIVSYLWPAATHEPASSDEEPQESDEDDSESSFFEFREDDVDY